MKTQGGWAASAIGGGVTERGSGRPIVFLRGAEPPDASSEVIELLSQEARVISSWLPGFGASALPPSYSSIDDLAYSQLDLIERLDLNNAVLVGVSFAGWVAAEMAVRSTARISRLVLGDAFGVHVGGPTDAPIADLYTLDAQTLASRAYADPRLAKWDIASATDEELLGYAQGRETQALIGWRHHMHNPVLKRWLHRIDVPTLVVWGGEDGIAARSLGDEYVARIPDARLSVIEGAGHFPHIERPRQFASEVLAFASVTQAA